MRSNILITLGIVLLATELALACKPSSTIDNSYIPSTPIKAVAVLKGNLNGSPVVGTIKFLQPALFEPIQITINITGLPTGQGQLKHGLHVHAAGISDTSDNVTAICGSSGPHFNPLNQTHGNITADVRHVGDYGNVISDNNGVIAMTFTDSLSQLYGPFSVLGRTIVLHQKEDDLGLNPDEGSKTTGNSGARIACGVIGISS